MAECSEGKTMLSVRVRVGELETGVIGRGGDEPADDVASEFRDLAFPLLYIPDGTVIVRNMGSWSGVGMLGRSE